MEANANVGTNFSAKLLLGASEAFKEFYLDAVIPEHLADAHRNGEIHIHDLDSYGTTLIVFKFHFVTYGNGKVLILAMGGYVGQNELAPP